MRNKWTSNKCYKRRKVNGSDCSILRYLSTIEGWCPVPENKNYWLEDLYHNSKDEKVLFSHLFVTWPLKQPIKRYFFLVDSSSRKLGQVTDHVERNEAYEVDLQPNFTDAEEVEVRKRCTVQTLERFRNFSKIYKEKSLKIWVATEFWSIVSW